MVITLSPSEPFGADARLPGGRYARYVSDPATGLWRTVGGCPRELVSPYALVELEVGRHGIAIEAGHHETETLAFEGDTDNVATALWRLPGPWMPGRPAGGPGAVRDYRPGAAAGGGAGGGGMSCRYALATGPEVDRRLLQAVGDLLAEERRAAEGQDFGQVVGDRSERTLSTPAALVAALRQTLEGRVLGGQRGGPIVVRTVEPNPRYPA